MSKRKRAAPVVEEGADAATPAAAASEAAAAVESVSAAAAPAAAAPSSSASKPHPCVARYASVNHWLLKNEPPYSLAALRSLPEQTEAWVGVRSHEAANIMRYGFRTGQRVLYYNASISNPHVAGTAIVASGAPEPDRTAWDPASPYFDPKTDRAKPTWFLRSVRYEAEFIRPVYLAELRLHSGEGQALHSCSLFRKLRLSIHPLTDAEFAFIVGLQHTPLPETVKLKPERSKSDGGTGSTNEPAAHPSRNRKKQKKAPAATSAAAAAADTSEQEEEAEPEAAPTAHTTSRARRTSAAAAAPSRAQSAPAAAELSATSRAAKRQRRQKD